MAAAAPRSAAGRIARLAGRALELVLPRFCFGCTRPLGVDPAPIGLCHRCRGRLEPVDPRRCCRGCLRSLPAERGGAPLCLACRRDPPPFERALALWRYRPPLDSVLRAFKFGGLDYLGDALARLAAERLRALPRAELDLALPVPMPWTRRLARGYNQAERFARPLARELGVPFGQVLARRGHRRRQSGLDRSERLRLPPSSFRVTDPRRVEGASLLLIDDIFTTGSTARAAAAALEAAGARRIEVLVAAWTPPDRPSHPP
jgi:ComF family protein